MEGLVGEPFNKGEGLVLTWVSSEILKLLMDRAVCLGDSPDTCARTIGGLVGSPGAERPALPHLLEQAPLSQQNHVSLIQVAFLFLLLCNRTAGHIFLN